MTQRATTISACEAQARDNDSGEKRLNTDHNPFARYFYAIVIGRLAVVQQFIKRQYKTKWLGSCQRHDNCRASGHWRENRPLPFTNVVERASAIPARIAAPRQGRVGTPGDFGPRQCSLRQIAGQNGAASDRVIGCGAEGQSRTDTGSPPPVFETGASTISPLRPGY